jgi:NlpC/P60 family putative phage cell wall peptidase
MTNEAAKTTVERSRVVAEAKTWLDTPYRHQGRLKGVGVDCIGLVIGVCHALDLTDYDITGYDKRPDGSLRKTMETQLKTIPLHTAQPGDVLLFQFGTVPVHVGIMLDENTLIHAYSPNRKVVANSLDARWRGLVAGAYELPGVE